MKQKKKKKRMEGRRERERQGEGKEREQKEGKRMVRGNQEPALSLCYSECGPPSRRSRVSWELG